MKKNIIFAVAVLLSGFLLGGITFYLVNKGVYPSAIHMPFTPRVPSQMIETSRAFSEIVSSVSPAVVNISTTKVIKNDSADDSFFDFMKPFHEFGLPKKWKEQSLGSGIIISSDGYIITNNHVVEQSEDIRVTLYDKRSFRGKIVGSDPKSDIAVIKIAAGNLLTVPLGDSDRLQVGEFVLAIGNPFGLSHTVTMGIISAVGRANVGIADYEDFIQTDAAINPGNSGGPLVNIKGELIGINTAIFSRSGGYQGIGFAVPINMARLIYDQLLKEGRIIRGWLGVTIQELTPDISQKFGLKDSRGALIGDVSKDSPADKAGILRGDVVLEFNGKTVDSVGSLRNIVSQTRVGTQIRLKLLRNNREINVTVTIAELPREAASAEQNQTRDYVHKNAFSGVTVMELTKDIAKQLGLNAAEKGVVVVRVEPGSIADEAGLKKGDVIQEIDKKKVARFEDYKGIISKMQHEDAPLLFLNRGGRKFYLALSK